MAKKDAKKKADPDASGPLSDRSTRVSSGYIGSVEMLRKQVQQQKPEETGVRVRLGGFQD